MTFPEWLKSEAQSNTEINDFICRSLPSIEWPAEELQLIDVVNHLKSQGVEFSTWSNILKYWALYLKHESNSRVINANEIREIREILVLILKWLEDQQPSLDHANAVIIAEAESQIAILEEKEVEIRYLQGKMN